MKALLLFAAFVIAWTAAGVFSSFYVDRLASPGFGSIVLLGMFFSGLVVSWVATVFVMDGSLKNFHGEKEQVEAERIGREYMNWSNLKGSALNA